MKLSERLVVKRSETGEIQPDVAKKIGISYPTYVYLENGEYKHKLSPKILGKLASYLDIPVGIVLESLKEDK